MLVETALGCSSARQAMTSAMCLILRGHIGKGGAGCNKVEVSRIHIGVEKG